MAKYDITILGNAPVDNLYTDVPEQALQDAGCTIGGWKKISVESMAKLTTDMTLHSAQPGGAAANTSYGMAQLGASVNFIGAYSNDDMGLLFQTSMRNNGVNVSPPKPNGRSLVINTFISHDENGKPERSFATTGSDRHIAPDDVVEDDIRNSRMVLAEAYLFNDEGQNAAAEKAFALARKHGVPVALSLAAKDVVSNHAETIARHIHDGLDLLIANEEEMAILLSTAHAQQPDHGHGLLHAIQSTPALITRGTEGAEFRHPRYGTTFVACPPLPPGAKAIDPTGAGDSFLAAFLTGYVRGTPVKECLAQGHRFAAQVVQQVGARLPVLNRDTVIIPNQPAHAR